MFHWKDNCLINFQLLHSVEYINVYVEINIFKVSRVNDNDTRQQIRKLVLKVRVKKETFIFLPIQKLFLSKKNFSIKNKLHHTVSYNTVHIWNDRFGSE